MKLKVKAWLMRLLLRFAYADFGEQLAVIGLAGTLIYCLVIFILLIQALLVVVL